MKNRRVLAAVVFFLAVAWCVVAGAAGDDEAASFPEGYTTERYQLDLEKAEKGEADAQFLMGYLHHRQVVSFVEPDIGTAFAWYQKAARQGHLQATQVLGLMYQQGEGTPADPDAAKRCYQYAADRGLAEARYALGLIYIEGYGVPRDDELGVLWLKRADQQNFSPATIALGTMVASGRGEPKDMEAAFAWFIRAAELGNSEGMLRVAGMYRTGVGVPQDIGIAVRWLEEAMKGTGRSQLLAINDLAWLLATCPQEEFRDGKRALELAELLVKSGRTKPGVLDTLAAACAANGLFDRAVQVQKEAIASLGKGVDPKLLASFRERLKGYKKGKGWTEP